MKVLGSCMKMLGFGLRKNIGVGKLYEMLGFGLRRKNTDVGKLYENVGILKTLLL